MGGGRAQRPCHDHREKRRRTNHWLQRQYWILSLLLFVQVSGESFNPIASRMLFAHGKVCLCLISGESFDSIYPAEGPASGGNYVTIAGSEFQATRSYVCTFRDLANSSRSVNFSAVYDESTEVRCVMGTWPFPEAITRLELRNNGTLVNTTSGPYLYNFKGENPRDVSQAC